MYKPFAFNEKPKDVCETTKNAVWKSVYDSWAPGRWVKATFRGQTFEWKSIDPVLIYTQGTRYAFESLFSLFSVTSANWLVTKEPHPLAIAVRSEVLCKLKPVQQMLDVAVCDCFSKDR